MRFSKSYLLLLVIVLVAFALRVYRLDFFSLRGDESFTVLFVQKPLAQMWYETLTVEPNPPLLYFLLRWWIDLAGSSEFVTRYFSLFFGVLCVPLIYRVTREILSSLSPSPVLGFGERGRVGEGVGLLAAFLIAINPYQIWHSQDVRNYTMWPALSLLALFFFWHWYSSETRGRDVPRTFGGAWHVSAPRVTLALFVLAELAALYTHYYEAFILLALNLFVFVTTFRDLKKLAQWIVSQIILAVLYLPYPLILSNRVSAYGEGSGRMGVALWDVARESFTAFVLSDTLDESLRAWLWIPFAFLALAGLVALWTRDRKPALLLLLYTAIPTLAVFGLNVIRPLYLERYLNGIAPVYYVLIAIGIVALAQRVAALITIRSAFILYPSSFILALASALALTTYWTDPAYAKAPDWRGLTNIINANAQPGDLIVQNFPETSLIYYDKTRLPLVVYPETYLPDTKTTQQLNAMNSNYQRVWFIPAAPDVWDPDEFVQAYLNRREDLLQQWNVGDFDLQLFATPSQFLSTMRPSKAEFGKILRLAGYRTTRDGDNLSVAFYWRVANNPNENYEMDVKVLDGEGNVLTKQRAAPVQGQAPTIDWRRNQLIVDRYEFSNVPTATKIWLQVCTAVTDICVPHIHSTTDVFVPSPLELTIYP